MTLTNTTEGKLVMNGAEYEPLVRSAEAKLAILAEYKDRQHEQCFYCHRVLPVGTQEDPFFNDHAYGANSINFVTYREDPFLVAIDGDFTKNWICQQRVWDSAR